MLMKKIQFQLMRSTIRPPTSGPIASASADALHDARADQHAGAAGEAARKRRQREDQEADDEDPAPPHQVGELAAGEHQRAERECVTRHDPLELGDLETK
jgi:hypothetical protein